MIGNKLSYRQEVCLADQLAVRNVVNSSGYFSDEEISIAVELAFYHRCGYNSAAYLDDFYAPGDGKIILAKSLYKIFVCKRLRVSGNSQSRGKN